MKTSQKLSELDWSSQLAILKTFKWCPIDFSCFESKWTCVFVKSRHSDVQTDRENYYTAVPHPHFTVFAFFIVILILIRSFETCEDPSWFTNRRLGFLEFQRGLWETCTIMCSGGDGGSKGWYKLETVIYHNFLLARDYLVVFVGDSYNTPAKPDSNNVS